MPGMKTCPTFVACCNPAFFDESSAPDAAALALVQDILLKAVGKEGAAKAGMQFGFVCKPGALCVSVNGKDAGTVKR